MSSGEHSELLTSLLRSGGHAAWNAWRDESSDVPVNLVGADLGGLDLSGLNLNEANLSRANLDGAKIVDASARRTTLVHVSFRGAMAKNSSFSEADLRYANLSEGVFKECDFEKSDFEEAVADGANFTKGRFSGVNFRKSSLLNTNFSDADLTGADFSGAIVGHTVFANNDLRQTVGLEVVYHYDPSSIGLDTIYRSRGQISAVFLRGAGVPEILISCSRSLVGIQLYSCFISYSSKDKEFAERLYTDLQSAGVRCWFAPADLRIGDRIRDELDRAIKSYDKMLLVLSENSIGSNWVRHEVDIALRREGEGGQTILFPMRVDTRALEVDDDSLSRLRYTRHIADFSGWRESHNAYQTAFTRLVRDLTTSAAIEMGEQEEQR